MNEIMTQLVWFESRADLAFLEGGGGGPITERGSKLSDSRRVSTKLGGPGVCPPPPGKLYTF